MASINLDEKALKAAKYGPIMESDPRVLAAKNYVDNRMNYLDANSP